jgi:multicomponent K+:H+ antiporter subunit D
MVRAGIRSLWAPIEREVPHVRLIELAPVMALLLLCVVMTVVAGPTMRFMEATANGLRMVSAEVQAPAPPPPSGPALGGGGE